MYGKGLYDMGAPPAPVSPRSNDHPPARYATVYGLASHTVGGFFQKDLAMDHRHFLINGFAAGKGA
jgi:hypothetical protein